MDEDFKTDIAVIKRDISQTNKIFTKVDKSLELMAELSKQVAVHEEVLKNLEDTIDRHREEDVVRAGIMTDRLEQYRISSKEDHARLAEDSKQNRKERNAEIMAELHKMNGALDSRLTKLDSRIRILENWKYYMMGLGAMMLFLATKIQWPGLFGG